MPKLAPVLLLCTGAAVGALGDRLIRVREAVDPAMSRRLDAIAAHVERLAVSHCAPAAIDDRSALVSRNELSTLLDEKLDGLLKNRRGTISEPAPPPLPGPTAAQVEAFARAQGMVEKGLHAGRWTDEDAMALRVVLVQVAAEERAELTRKMVVAINQDRIRVETSGPPF
jgi:hypothetical protein